MLKIYGNKIKFKEIHVYKYKDRYTWWIQGTCMHVFLT